MSKTIKIPGVGPVKAEYAYAGGAVVVGILAVAYYRHKKNAAAAAASAASADTSGTATDTSGSAYDPSSGYSPTGYGSGYGNCPYGRDVYGNCLPAPTGASSAYTNNNDWMSAAEEALANAGIDTTVSATAISKVLAGLTVTTAQKQIFLEAIGILGQPPQGYPQPIHVSDPSGGDRGSLGAPGTPSISAVDQHGASVSWTAPATGTADHYEIWTREGSGRNTKAGTSSSTSFRIGYFKPHTSHAVWVNGIDSSGNRGPSSAAANFTTHR